MVNKFDEKRDSGYFWVRLGKFWTVGEHDSTLMHNNMEFAIIGHGSALIVDEVGPGIDKPENCKSLIG